MKEIVKDRKYYNIVKDILDNETFNIIDKIEHHGTSRMGHSIKVSYYSYIIANKFKLHSVETARAGLLHDFFMSSDDRSNKDKFLSTFVHPKYAVINSKELFLINDLEQNIIRTHMFPMNLAIPKYTESWIVSLVDKYVTICEFGRYYASRLKYATNYLYLLVLLNTISFIK